MSIYNERKSMHGKPYTPFYYVIGWSEIDKWYVGSRTARRSDAIAHPDELMKTYFTSSYTYVWPTMDQYGLPDIVWTFPCPTAEQARYHETRIMNEFHNFLKDERWLNHNINGAIHMTPEIVDRIRKTRERKGLNKNRSPYKRKTTSAAIWKRRKFAIDGVEYSLKDLSEKSGIPLVVLRERLHEQWTVERAIATPYTGKRTN